MLGDTNTGKSSLVLRFVEGYYRDFSREATVGAHFITKRLTVGGLTSKVQIWDTAGQDQFKKLAPMYYQKAAAAVVCYDVSSPKSFHALRYWVDELQKNAPSGLVIALCATKCDLVENPDFGEVEQLAHATGSMFFSTSAKENTNVNSVFEKVTERVLQIHDEGRSVNVNLTPLQVPASPLRGSLSTPTIHSSPKKVPSRMSDVPSDSPMADEKKDSDDIVIQNLDSGDSSKNPVNSSGCADTYLCGDMQCGDMKAEELQQNCVIS